MRKNVLLIGAMLMASMSMMAQTKGGRHQSVCSSADGEEPCMCCTQGSL